MKSKVGIKHRPLKAIKEIEKIGKAFKGKNMVQVGLPKGSNAYPDGASVIMVGTVHEFGSPAKRIPQRSFLRSTLVQHKREYKKLFKKITFKIIKGELDIGKALSLIGLQVQTDVKEKITDIKTPALKAREGNPLIDTGHLRQSIVFKVNK